MATQLTNYQCPACTGPRPDGALLPRSKVICEVRTVFHRFDEESLYSGNLGKSFSLW